MSTLQKVLIDCPTCGAKFKTEMVASTCTFTHTLTDFHRISEGLQPLPYMVHVCNHCGYGAEKEYYGYVKIGAETRTKIYTELAPKYSNTNLLSGAEKYEIAAQILEWANHADQQVAEMWLKAAYCAFDEGDTEAERFYRLRAVEYLMEALTLGQIAIADRAAMVYLVGELWRRIGHQKNARYWFEQVQGEIVDEEDQAWIVLIAEQQSGLNPREVFD